MQPFDESRGIGEKIIVPRITCPAVNTFAHIDQMPIHVNDTDRQGDFVSAKFSHQTAQLLIAVGPVATPPIAQRPARQ
jgi:hypothetical protein